MSTESGHQTPNLPGMSYVQKVIHGSHDKGGLHISARPLIIAMVVAQLGFLLLAPRQTLQNYSLLLFFAPVWMTVLLVKFSFERWVEMVRAEFIQSQEHILLELRLPRDTRKTPQAMETILTNLHIGSGEGNWYKKYWKGGVRPWWAFEIVSLGGQVRFFVWTRATLRRGLESYFYAQYPGMEFIEAEDYSRIYDPSAHENDMFGAEFALTKEDPIPIKTYMEYELAPGTKPEEQIDPLTQVIELMGSLGPKEQMWFQIVFRMTKKEKWRTKDWKDEAGEIIAKRRKDFISKRSTVDPVTGQVREVEGFPNPTKGQQEGIFAIERNTNKPGFDVGMRAIYTAPKGSYQGGMISYMLSMLKPFSNEGGNGFKPASAFSAKFQDYPWEDRTGHHKHKEHVELVEYYRRRSYFHSPYVGPWMVLSSEELATIFHVPSSTIQTPSLPRIQSATGGAPANLPT